MSTASSRRRGRGRRNAAIKILLAGKHELASRIFANLQERQDVELAVVLCRSESCDGTRKGLSSQVPTGMILEDDPRAPLLNAIEKFQPDLLISAGYDRIVRPAVFHMLPRAVNIHFGWLPRYRGCWSIPWAILNDDGEIGVTLHDIDASIDGGPIIDQKAFKNNRSLGCADLYSQAVEIGAELFDRFMKNPTVAGRPQDEHRATYYPDSFPNDFHIRWKQTTSYVCNYLRAAHFPPYPGAYSIFNGVKICFDWPAACLIKLPSVVSGTVVKENGRYWIATLNGFVSPETALVAGRRCGFSEVVLDLDLEGKRL